MVMMVLADANVDARRGDVAKAPKRQVIALELLQDNQQHNSCLGLLQMIEYPLVIWFHFEALLVRIHCLLVPPTGKVCQSQLQMRLGVIFQPLYLHLLI
jgi:hypothetical protein